MKYLVRVSPSGDYRDIYYACVTLAPEALESIKNFQRIHIRAIKEYWPSFLCVEIFDDMPAFYDETLPEELEAYAEQLDNEDLDKVLLPDDFVIPEATVRVECTTLKIGDDGFAWCTLPKHGDTEHNTVLFRNTEVFDDA